jgi:hypothetical protein
MPRWITLALGLSLLGPGTLGAQTVPQLSPGDTVRIAEPGVPRVSGTLLEVSESALTFTPMRTAEARTVRLSDLEGLQVARGRRSLAAYTLAGIGIGLAVGLAAGLAWETSTPLHDVPAGAQTAAIGAVGAFVGGLTGVTTPLTRWRRVALP